MANLGNNHSGDYGKEALVDGRAQLDSVGVTAVGAGADAEEAGQPADVIFGHHAHRLQPFEMVNDAAVFWGLGNFVWPQQSDAGATTAVARVVVAPDGSLDACLIPAFIENSGQPVLTGEPECGPSR